MPMTFLDRDSICEVFQVINLPIAYLDLKQELGIVAEYKLGAECIVFNLTRTQFMLLTKKGNISVRQIHWDHVRPKAPCTPLGGGGGAPTDSV